MTASMSIELVKILEAAKEYRELAMKWFDMYILSQDELDWNTCKEYEMKARGLLEAYEIMTGKHIYPIQIDEELALA